MAGSSAAHSCLFLSSFKTCRHISPSLLKAMKTTLLGGVGCGCRSSREDGAKERKANDVHNLLELRLGISLNSSNKVMAVTTTSTSGAVGQNHGGELQTTTKDVLLHLGGCHDVWEKTWPIPESGNTFVVHPWSLAARQQKAALEKAYQSSQTLTSAAQHLPTPVIGWPPIRAFRRKFVGLQPSKVEMEVGRDAKRGKTIQQNWSEVQQAMLVKVNMEGCAVGRKIDLKIHDSYESLSHALKKLFTNFLPITATYDKDREPDEQVEGPMPNCILSYEDHEGDRMILGDVPWKMFITSVKRLYVTPTPRVPKEDGRMMEKKT